jgi:hypothetical protein
VANSGQRCRWLCVGGANGGRSAAVFYGALDMELANMNPIDNDDDDNTQVYKKPWVGLTEEEINACDPSEECWGLHKIARAIEDKLKEKNA